MSGHGLPLRGLITRQDFPAAGNFYGGNGQPVAWMASDRSVYLFDGTPVAWMARNGDVHTFDGRYLGWFQDGALWDREGRCALFSLESRGGPQTPALQSEPPRSEPRHTPTRRAPELPQSRPRRRRQWADITDEGFFCPPSQSEIIRKRASRRPLNW
jgi:hypothetical protein